MQYLSWVLIGTQMLTWALFNLFGGKISRTKIYVLFAIGMGAGNIGAGIETYISGGAWGTFASQIYYLAWTAYGIYQRLRDDRKLTLAAASH